MSIDAQPPLPKAFQATLNPLASGGGALLFPVTWAVIYLGMTSLTPAHQEGIGAAIADALVMVAPMLLSYLIAAAPATGVFLRTAGHPAADGGKAWMTLSAGCQLLALPTWAFAGRAGWSNFDLGLAFLIVALVLCLLSIPLAIVGWVRFGWRALRPVRVAPSLD